MKLSIIYTFKCYNLLFEFDLYYKKIKPPFRVEPNYLVLFCCTLSCECIVLYSNMGTVPSRDFQSYINQNEHCYKIYVKTTISSWFNQLEVVPKMHPATTFNTFLVSFFFQKIFLCPIGTHFHTIYIPWTL
jgi:hypothetical protein